MNHHEKKYARKRLEDAKREMLVKVNNRHSKEGKSLSNKEKYDLIKLGKAKLFPKSIFLVKSNEGYRSDTVSNLYDFSKFEWSPKNDSESIKKDREKIESEFTRVLDELMLGDCDQALSMIKDFEKFYK